MGNPRPTNENDRGESEERTTGHGWVSEVEPNTEGADPRPI